MLQSGLKIANENEAVFIKRPVVEKKMFSALLGKSYIKSDIIHDTTSKFYNVWGRNKDKSEIKRMADFPYEIELGSKSYARPTREEVDSTTSNESVKTKIYEEPKTRNMGFCIRTCESIPFNPNRPMNESAYRTWAQFGNVDYQENFCHRTGKPSNGRTSMRNPILF